jgi:hypothetical protein
VRSGQATGCHPYYGTFNRVTIRSEKRRPTLGRRGSLGHLLLAHEVKIHQAPVVGPGLSPRSGFGSTRNWTGRSRAWLEWSARPPVNSGVLRT